MEEARGGQMSRNGLPRDVETTFSRYRELFELAPNGYLTTDVDGRVAEVNRAAEAIFGRTRDDLAGISLSTFVPEAERGRFRARIEALRSGRAERIQDWQITFETDAASFDAEVTVGAVADAAGGEVSSLVWLVRDVTERKQAEERLRDRERQLKRTRNELRGALAWSRAVLDSAVDGIVTINESGAVESVNPSAEKMFGYRADELVGENVGLLMPSPHREEHDGFLRRYLDSGEKRIIGIGREVVGRRKDGSEFPLDLAVAEFFHDDRRAFVGILRDVTERHRLEEQFRQAQKMEAVGRLAGGVAHDFNTLLGSIMGYSEMLLDGLAADHPLRRAAEQIHRGAGRGAALTRHLLAFSRHQVLQPRVLDLGALIADMDDMLRRLIGADVELVHSGEAVLGPVRVDAAQFEQAIMNLVVNARDAMPRGGRLTITTQNVEIGEDEAARKEVPAAGPYVLVAMSDTGCGMDEETRHRLFEPFFTTKERGKGTGLGLSTVYGFVKQSHGAITVKSAAGRGTTFRIFLPRVDDEPVLTAEQEPAPAGTTTGTETVLLVEDDDMFRDLLREILEASGYRVLATGEPTEALALSRDHGGPLHLVVTDMVMPGMTGVELVDRLLEENPEMKVLLMSGYTGEDLEQRGASGDGVPFLQKPFSPKEFLRTVREVLGFG
jgi:hypothetical protein